MNVLKSENMSVPAPLDILKGRAVGSPPSGDVITQIRAVLGEGVVLLPIPLGQKFPTHTGWQQTTLERMLDGRYLGELLKGNIGVLLGKPSGNICAIDIDDDAAVEPFLALNPRLRETFRTKGNRGCQIWVRVKDAEVPNAAKLSTKDGSQFGEWRADGNQSVIYGRHPKGDVYQWVINSPVVEIAFDEIAWPDNLKLPWPDRAFCELVDEVGAPIQGTSINVSFFARVFAMRHMVAVRRGDLCIYSLDTGLWVPQGRSEISRELWRFVRAFLDELGVPVLKARLKQSTIDEIFGLLLTDGVRIPEPASSRIIHVKNGMVDLNGEPPLLLPYSPDHGSLQRVEQDYDPDASCPRFTAWLESALEPQDQLLLQEWVGAVLLGANYAHRIMLLSGDAGAGKTSMVSLVEKLVGRTSCLQLRPTQLGGRFETREYANKRLLTGNDVPADFLTGKNTAILKSLTGGDTLTAERKMENEGVSFKGDLHMVISSNDELVLRLEGDADAWGRRLLSIHMRKPDKLVVVPDFANYLFDKEGEGILAWTVEGARRHIANGYQYVLSLEQMQRVQRIINASDGVALFVEQCLVRDESGKADATMEQLFEAYDKFAKDHEFERFKKSVLGRKLVPLIQSKLGLHQRNDLGVSLFSPKGHLRGFRGLIIQ